MNYKEEIKKLINESTRKGFGDVGVHIKKKTMMRCNIFKLNQIYKHNVSFGNIVIVDLEELFNFYNEQDLFNLMSKIVEGKIVDVNDLILEYCTNKVRHDEYYKKKFTWYNTGCSSGSFTIDCNVNSNW